MTRPSDHHDLDKLILKLRGDGLKWPEISKRCGMSLSTIKKRAQVLGLQDLRKVAKGRIAWERKLRFEA